MQPPSEPTKLESENGFSEYIGSGKLNGKKAIITGGEYVFKMGIFSSRYMSLLTILPCNIVRELVEPFLS